MPKAKSKTKKKEALTHNGCRMRACIWCGKKRAPGSLTNISQKNLTLIQKHGSARLDPATDDMLPKVICTSCRLGLRELESPRAEGNKHHSTQLPPLFDYE